MKKSIRAIGWTIENTNEITLGLFSHKIKLDQDHTPSVDHRRRLNQPMQEVVKKEIIKWLDAGVIYLISNCTWVSPMKYIPKNGGIMVVKNEKIDLISIEPVIR